ncbi:hypothetical protein C7S18_09595 [Ahniella affigens]|uniref:Peptidase S74 domain-containing protein n=1 Tax=Ahniella affigens TaxID=2021234 RepID=A0A2P1PRG1_9GAMM|nr:tail fiber domain-containing protein [Ahniella affigens]AVP97433.1 hypothetical protein C7S18_09595 [Ahniella affigens]
MKRIALCIALALSASVQAAPWTYRGTLNDGGLPANGRYDIRLSLLDSAGAKSLVFPLTFNAVEVKNGAFAIDVDFGTDLGQFGTLKIKTEVAQGGSGFVALGEPKSFDAKAALGGVCWDTQGNAGTNPATDFLGTTDNQPIELRAANARVLRAESSTEQFSNMPITANLIAGSNANIVTAGVRGATIAGGGVPSGDSDPTFNGEAPNRITDHYGFVGGGIGNVAGNDAGSTADAAFASVVGGRFNDAAGSDSAALGGSSNLVSGSHSLAAGGEGNTVSGSYAGAVAGILNHASGQSSSVVGGNNNRAAGADSIVLGGFSNCAGGDRSFAAGTRARVLPATDPGGNNPCANQTGYTGTAHHGTFMWADSVDASFVSSGPDQFLIRSRGGVAINATPISGSVELSVTADSDDSDFANMFLRQRTNNAGILVSAGGATATNDNNAGFFLDHFNGAGGQARRLALNSDGSVLIRSNVTAGNTGVSMAAGSGAWSALSDRSVKMAITAIDPASVLDRLVAMPVSEWSYIAQGEGVRHLGPMAQDFAAAFGLGENDTTISTIDADGVALAAIQGLNAKLEAELRQAGDRNAQLQIQLEQLATRLAALEAAKGQ